MPLVNLALAAVLALSWHWPPFLYPETDGSHSLFRPGDALSNGTIELQRIPMR